ncbi:hypothetical protein D3C72_1780620 [compost metagenome]
MHHARADEAEIDFLGRTVIGYRADCVVRVASGDVVVVDVRVGDHRFVDYVEINDDFGEIFRVGVRLQS